VRTGGSAQALRNANQNLVPEPQGQRQEDREGTHRSSLQVRIFRISVV
jgi:hypothetical protein